MNLAYNAIFQSIEANPYHRIEPDHELTLIYELGGTGGQPDRSGAVAVWYLPCSSKWLISAFCAILKMFDNNAS